MMILADALVLVNADDDDLFIVEELPAPTDSPGCLEHVYGDDFVPFDGITWELGPDPDDSAWWADQNGSEPDYDALADDAAATDALCRGLIFA